MRARARFFQAAGRAIQNHKGKAIVAATAATVVGMPYGSAFLSTLWGRYTAHANPINNLVNKGMEDANHVLNWVQQHRSR